MRGIHPSHILFSKLKEYDRSAIKTFIEKNGLFFITVYLISGFKGLEFNAMVKDGGIAVPLEARHQQRVAVPARIERIDQSQAITGTLRTPTRHARLLRKCRS